MEIAKRQDNETIIHLRDDNELIHQKKYIKLFFHIFI